MDYNCLFYRERLKVLSFNKGSVDKIAFSSRVDEGLGESITDELPYETSKHRSLDFPPSPDEPDEPRSISSIKQKPQMKGTVLSQRDKASPSLCCQNTVPADPLNAALPLRSLVIRMTQAVD